MTRRGYETGKNFRIFKVMEDYGNDVFVGNYLKITGNGIEGDLFKFHDNDVIWLSDVKVELPWRELMAARLFARFKPIKTIEKTIHFEEYTSPIDKIKHAMSEIKRGYPISEELRDIYIEYIKWLR